MVLLRRFKILLGGWISGIFDVRCSPGLLPTSSKIQIWSCHLSQYLCSYVMYFWCQVFQRIASNCFNITNLFMPFITIFVRISHVFWMSGVSSPFPIVSKLHLWDVYIIQRRPTSKGITRSVWGDPPHSWQQGERLRDMGLFTYLPNICLQRHSRQSSLKHVPPHSPFFT